MSTIRRNLASMLMSQVATFTLTLITVTILPKRLGATTYGMLAFAVVYLGYFGLAASLGSQQFLVKTIAREPSEFGRYIFNALAMKLLLGTLLAGAAIAGAHLLGYQGQTLHIIEVASIGVLLVAVMDVLAAALQGTERMGRLALWQTIQQYATGAIALALLLDNKGVVVYALVIACGPVIPIFANGIRLWPEITGRRRADAASDLEAVTEHPSGAGHRTKRLDFRLWRVIAVGGLPFVSWSLVLLIYGSIDILMLERMTGSDTVAWYTLAWTWVGIPVFLPSLLVTVILPSLSNNAFGNTAEFSRTVKSALRLVVFVGTPMAIGIALVAADIVALFHYPAGFENTVTLIRILALHIPIVGVTMIMATALTARDRQTAWLVVGCIAAVFNPVTNLFAIPWTAHRFGDGAVGAAIVTVATEMVMLIGAICIRPAGILDRSTIWFMLRCVAAGVAMIPTVLLLGHTYLAVKVAVGVITFAGASIVLRLVPIRTARGYAIQVLRSLRRTEHLSPVPTGVSSK